ncbi:hypothetical protein F0L68_30825 [Solihabitans fulvus]|uniref:Cysteine-rich CPCC domain-containing protein n=1 Tax=Solihabitans fulvus TaxID=1892852 RepID=A0A5B2WTM0_9PSEU|nr:hypothetical protein F0L68_30825 [Solihabitans fulvus]
MSRQELRDAYPFGGGPYPCPCCHLPTLDARGLNEICRECGWEDDGQDDPHADEVWSGPNGAESLTDARNRYSEYVASLPTDDQASIAEGRAEAWWSEVKRQFGDEVPE